jgi:hypothetical protein
LGQCVRFCFNHEQKIRIFTDAGCPLSTLPQRNGKPYLRDYFMLWLRDLRIAVAMVDQPGPDQFVRLRLFLRQFLPVLRSVREQIDLFIVTPDQRRKFAYEKLLRTIRAIHKLGLGSLAPRIKPYSVRPPVPTIIETTWPKADEYDEIADVADDWNDVSDGHAGHKGGCPAALSR